MKAIIIDLRPYESLSVILDDVNQRLRKLGPVDCVSCYFSQVGERFSGFMFSYNEAKERRENLVYQIEGTRIPNSEDVEGFVNQSLGEIEEVGQRMRYMRLYWRSEYTLVLMTVGRRSQQ